MLLFEKNQLSWSLINSKVQQLKNPCGCMPIRTYFFFYNDNYYLYGFNLAFKVEDLGVSPTQKRQKGKQEHIRTKTSVFTSKINIR